MSLICKLLIGGQWLEAQGQATFARHNPISGKISSQASAASLKDAAQAASAAAAAFPTWSNLPPNERRSRLLKAADLFAAHSAEFSARMTAETGATASWGNFNVQLACNILREAASMTTQICGEQIPSDIPGNLSLAVRQPVGVILGIAPWNAPVILGVRAIAMPLACGNTVVLKSSELCPATHALIGELLQQAGLGDGVVNVVSNAPKDAAEIVRALIEHPAVRRVNFTGSTRVGRIIAETAARQFKPALLELGGKNPMLVLDDADLDAAVDAATFGAFLNQGQICMSTERLIVDERVADDFLQRLVAKVARLPVGDPSEGDVVLGPLVTPQAAEHVQALIERAVAQGAELLAGGARHGSILPPAILDKVTSDMDIYAEESFGPVLSVIRVKDSEEAIRIANDTEYGLSAAIFSRDIARALQIARRIESGICHINGPTVHDEAQMPFGGVKSSGYGRFGGKAGIDAFSELRWLTIQCGPRHYPF